MGKAVKRQHYIPQMVLRRHVIPYDQKKLYLYNKQTKATKFTTPKNVACKESLYELRDENGMIDQKSRNIIENNFGKWEDCWFHILNKIESHDSLSEDDFKFLYLMITCQYTRVPKMIEIGGDFISSKVVPPISLERARNIYKEDCSLVGTLTPEAKPLFDLTLRRFLPMSILFLESAYPFVLPIEMPLMFWSFSMYDYVYAQNYVCVFPFSSTHCIVLTPNQTKIRYIYLTSEEVKAFNRQVLLAKNRRFFVGAVNPGLFDEKM